MKNKIKGHLTEVFVLITAAFLVAADQITKWIISDSFKLGQSVSVIPRVLNFTYVQNEGAVFGILKDHPWVFNSVTIVAVIAALVLLISGKVKKKLYIWAIGLIISGGIGNMIDRLTLKYVVDFINVIFINFPYVFNIADCCVVIGCCLVILQVILEVIEEEKAKKAKKSVTLSNENLADDNPDSEESYAD